MCLSVCVPVDMHAYAGVCARMFVMMNLIICNQENNSDTEKRQKKKKKEEENSAIHSKLLSLSNKSPSGFKVATWK